MDRGFSLVPVWAVATVAKSAHHSVARSNQRRLSLDVDPLVLACVGVPEPAGCRGAAWSAVCRFNEERPLLNSTWPGRVMVAISGRWEVGFVNRSDIISPFTFCSVL